MTSHHDPESGLTSLWPTVIVERIIPGHEAANRALRHLIERLDRDHRNLTTDYRSANLLTVEDPAVAWLKECINFTVQDYFRRMGMNYSIAWTVQAWANINRFGDYHDSHNHPHAYLSGTYYVSIPTTVEPLETRDDIRPGRLTLYDPRGPVNMTAIKGDPYIESEYTVDPQPGMILLWPAFVSHYVHPNLSKEHRISVSFNVMLKWSDDYLPEQT